MAGNSRGPSVRISERFDGQILEEHLGKIRHGSLAVLKQGRQDRHPDPRRPRLHRHTEGTSMHSHGGENVILTTTIQKS